MGACPAASPAGLPIPPGQAVAYPGERPGTRRAGRRFPDHPAGPRSGPPEPHGGDPDGELVPGERDGAALADLE